MPDNKFVPRMLPANSLRGERPEIDIWNLPLRSPLLTEIIEQEAACLKERLSGIPWYAKQAEADAKVGVNLWMRLAGSYMTGASEEQIQAKYDELQKAGGLKKL